MMNYKGVYQTVKAKLTALVKNAAVRLPNETPAEPTELDIDVTITETDSNPDTEETTKHNVSIDMLTSVPVSTGTERINNIVSKLVAAFDPLQQRDFWTTDRPEGEGRNDDKKHFVRISSVSQKQPNTADHRYQINVRVLAIIHT
jgi:hypothetical protein